MTWMIVLAWIIFLISSIVNNFLMIRSLVNKELNKAIRYFIISCFYTTGGVLASMVLERIL